MMKTRLHEERDRSSLADKGIKENNAATQGWIVYPIGSKPKLGLSILLGIQQYLTMFGATVLVPFIVAEAFRDGGIPIPAEALALLISTMFFVSGITTLIQQSPIGNKLPIIQGGTFSFIGPMIAIVGAVAAKGLGWKAGLANVSMCVLFAAFFEIIFGYTGLLGLIKRTISPIAIAPTIAMIGLALYDVGAPRMAGNWAISIITLAALILFSQVFSGYSRIFLLFPVLLAILVGWFASLIGTVTGWIPEGNPANLAGRIELIQSAQWFTIRPAVPFKWGLPTFGEGILAAGTIGMLAGYLGSMVESIGDYYTCARIAEAPVPTEKMISRGLGAEGIGCVIAGLFQTANGTTSYSENIGSIGLTRVASRRVIRTGAVVMLVLPLFGKFGASLATLPTPVTGAMFVGLFGLIAAVGLSNLQFVNLNNARNLFIIGIAFFAGLSFPDHFQANPIEWNSSQIAETLGRICQTILTTGMAVTAIFGILLDNLLPGATRAERGLERWEADATEEAWEKAEAEWKKVAAGEVRKISRE